MEVAPGENVEDEEDNGCTRRTPTRKASQSHLTKTTRIEKHDATLKRGDSVPTSFQCLPSEIHHAVFSNVEDIYDLVRLSLSNRYFWALGLPHIEDHIVSSLAPWAGERIICVTDQCDPHEFPPGLLSSTEQEDLLELNRIHNLNTISIKHSWKKVGGPSLSERLRDWFKEYESQHPMSHADKTEIITGLKPEILEFYPRDQPWALRNLTTKEYVRGEAIALKDSFIHGPHIDVIGFSEVLLSRISWSNRPVEVGYGRNMSQGKWAGHRFDISPLAKIEHDRATHWIDVSNELLREIDQIVASQEGEDWREHLSRRHEKVSAPVALGYS